MAEASALLSSDTSEKLSKRMEEGEEQTLVGWPYYNIKT